MTARTSTDTGHFSMQPGLWTLDAAQRFLARLLGAGSQGSLPGSCGRGPAASCSGTALARQLDALFVGQRIVAHFPFTHWSPPSLRAHSGARECSRERGQLRLADWPAGARCSAAPARDTCCCAASGPRSSPGWHRTPAHRRRRTRSCCPTSTRQPPHIPVPSTMIEFRLTMVLILLGSGEVGDRAHHRHRADSEHVVHLLALPPVPSACR